MHKPINQGLEGLVGSCGLPGIAAATAQDQRVASFGVKNGGQQFTTLMVTLDAFQRSCRPQNSPLLEELRATTGLTIETVDAWIASERLVISSHPKQRPMAQNITNGMTALDIPVVATLARLLLERDGFRWFVSELRREIERLATALANLNMPLPREVSELRAAHVAALQNRER